MFNFKTQQWHYSENKILKPSLLNNSSMTVQCKVTKFKPLPSLINFNKQCLTVWNLQEPLQFRVCSVAYLNSNLGSVWPTYITISPTLGIILLPVLFEVQADGSYMFEKPKNFPIGVFEMEEDQFILVLMNCSTLFWYIH